MEVYPVSPSSMLREQYRETTSLLATEQLWSSSKPTYNAMFVDESKVYNLNPKKKKKKKERDQTREIKYHYLLEREKKYTSKPSHFH